jgi:Asp-tRNA(Asn)/Glu-tRNA(Gln) amidotransferase A subunit family amidase
MSASESLPFETASHLAALISRRVVSPVEVVGAHIRRIEECEPQLNAFVTSRTEQAMEEAKKADGMMASGRPVGSLHGVPIVIKDEAHLAGNPTTYGVGALRRFVRSETAPDVRRLKDAGAIILGKTNMPEFGHKAVTDNRLVGPTSSPFDLGTNAGGSSGGSAAAVGACFAALAQGGDGGGSIRIPAALSGVYGLKPSWGRVPTRNRPDAYAFALPMVSYGPITRTVEDAALMLQVIAGAHSSDPLSLPDEAVDYVAAVDRDIRGRRAAYWPDFGGFPVSGPVARAVEAAVARLVDAGLHVDQINRDLGAPIADLQESWKRGASLNYAILIESLRPQGIDLLGEHRDEVSPSFTQYVERGARLTAVEHRTENALRSRVFDRLEEILERYDFILTPTLSVEAVENVGNGETVGPGTVDGVVIDSVIGWSLCFPVNFTGHPAASAPAGFTEDNHPVGLQIIGRRFRDDEVLALSGALERAAPWYSGYRERLAV